MSRRWKPVLVLLPLAVSCSRGEGAPGTPAAAVGVRTATVEQRAFPQSVVATGIVTPRPGRFVALGAPAPSRVARVLVSPGQRVRAGDTLVVFERAPFEAAARSADAAVRVAQAAHDRAERLAAAGVLPRKDVEQTAADLAAAQATAVTAHRSLELSELRTPIAGVVTTMAAVLGQSADAGQVLVEVVDPDALDIVFALTPDAASQVRAGAEVAVRGGDEPLGTPLGEGVVTAVGVSLDTVTRAVAVRARIARPLRALRVGESVTGRITTGVHPGALAVPAEALVPAGDAFRIFVVDSAGVAHARTVTIGARADSLVEITAGLRAGETVVTYGAYGMEDSVKVVRARP